MTTTDYGHDLLFGTFVTPVNQAVEQAVAPAVRELVARERDKT